MARVKKPRTRTDLIISLVVHAAVIGVIFYWAAKTGIIPEEISKAFNIAQNKKPAPPKPKPPEPPKVLKQDLKQASIPTSVQQPTSAGPSAKMADASALAPRGDALFGGAAVRDSNAAPAAVVQGQGTMGTAPRPASVAPPKISLPSFSTGALSMFSGQAIKPSTIAGLLEQRQSAAAAQDAISSEQISKSGVSDAAEVVSKVTGTTIVDGKFVVVRGLSDRYNSTTLNGGDIPSADPYRKAAQLDLVPAQMVDRIIVNKTFTPDQRGDFAGGAVNLVTKSFPGSFLFSYSLGASYNTQSSLNDGFASAADSNGKYDWAGLDDGTRELPAIAEETLPAEIPFRNPNSPVVQALGEAFQLAQFAPVDDRTPVNHNFSVAVGDTALLFGKRFGYFAGLSYRHDYSFYDDGRRVSLPAYEATPKYDLRDTRGVDESSWGSTVTLAYELAANHELGFTFVYNQSGESQARRLVGYHNAVGGDYVGDSMGSFGAYLDSSAVSWTERNLNTYQLKGRHRLAEVRGIQLDWLASMSNTSQDEPYSRYFAFFGDPFGFLGLGPYFLPLPNTFEPEEPAIYFRRLEEDNLNYKADLSIPFSQWGGLEGQVKLGGLVSDSERQYNERAFEYESDAFDPTFNQIGDPNGYIRDPGNAAYIQNARGFNNSYTGQLTVEALYGMMELPLHPHLRLIGGARVEATDLRISNLDLDDGQVEGNNIRQTDVLPALGLVWNLRSNMLVRASYSSTIARPTFREISPVTTFDFAGGDTLTGNTNLQLTSIANYDLRWEWFPRPGEVVALSLFYKELTAPIEKTVGSPLISFEDGVTYENAANATLQGVEFEVRKSLDFLDIHLREFTVGLNFSYIQSEVPRSSEEIGNRALTPFPAEPTRPLYDQSPYILNADLTYDNPHRGTVATLLFSIAGERLALVGLRTPDVFEQPVAQLDFVVSQRLSKRWKARFSARNLFDPVYERAYDAAASYNIPSYSAYRKGRQFGLSLSYDY